MFVVRFAYLGLSVAYWLVGLFEYLLFWVCCLLFGCLITCLFCFGVYLDSLLGCLALS